MPADSPALAQPLPLPRKSGGRTVLHGIAASAGIGIGRARFMHRNLDARLGRKHVLPSGVGFEAERLAAAVRQVIDDFSGVRDKVRDKLKEQAAIIDAHIMICEDPKLTGTALELIKNERLSAEWAMEEATQALSRTFAGMDSPYLRDRMQDIRVVADRILACLMGHPTAVTQVGAAGPDGNGNSNVPAGEQHILLAHDLTPADTLALPPGQIISIVTEMGGKTAHTGILARSLRIPCVVGVTGLESAMEDGDLIIVDALKGLVIVNPDPTEVERCLEVKARYEAFEKRIRTGCHYPAETEDGIRVKVCANLEMAKDAKTLEAQGAEGIGLYRTEFGFMYRKDFPSEQELYDDYRQVATALPGRRVVFRTLDIGADKLPQGAENLEEANPALGLRAIRYCLRHQYIFRRQMRAILRASAHGQCALMFPLISGVKELKQAKSVLNEVKQELEAENLPFDRDIPVGIMVELPAAVLIADSLAQEADFFSIGTNDLIQYSLGIDRGNKHVAYLYQPLHPAIVRAIRYVTEMGHRAGISVGICGEMASDPYCLPILLATGVDEISITPQAIPGIKHLIRRSNAEEYRELLGQVTTAGTSRQIVRLVSQTIYERFREDLDFFSSSLETDS